MKHSLLTFIKENIITTDSDIEKILTYFHYRKVKKHEILTNEGEICKEFYFILKGSIRIFFITEEGKEKTRHIATDNLPISALSSFISRTPSLEIVESLEETELLYIHHKDFFMLVKDSPGWAKFYTLLLETAYIGQTKRIESRITMDAQQRFESMLQTHPHYLHRISNKILASYLDISQETLSRLKSGK